MSTNSTQEPQSLWEFICQLVAVPAQPPSDDEAPWFEPGIVYEVEEGTYMYFLEVLPPRWIEGNWFAFGEGAGPFRLFGKQQDTHFARELTDGETRLFCKLSRVPLDQ